MKRWRNRALFLSGAAFLAIAIPALSQETQTPESILPPGFEEPPQQPPSPPENGAAPDPAAPPTAAPVAPPLPGLEAIENSAAEDLEALEALERPPPIEIPDFARRPIDVVGVIGPGEWGLDQDAYGTANG